MLYFAIVYYSWVGCLALWGALSINSPRRCAGLAWVIAGAVIQVFAHFLHLAEWQRLAGDPHRIYVWTGPLLIAVFGTLMWLFGLLVQLRSRRNG